MSVTDKTNRLVEGISVVKENLTTALQDKGVTVAPEAKLKDFPAMVANIEVGEKADLTNLTADNIKSGVTINGVTGTFTNDANATADKILVGYWAYVKGQLVDGTMGFSSGLERTGELSVYVGSGYLSQGESLTLTDSNLIASNILQGKTIFGVSGSIDLTNLIPDNIRKGVVINGVTGTYEGESGGGNGALFRVSGAGSTEANGDYFDTGETKNNLPIYKNENNIYMYFSTQCGYSWANGWCLSPTVIDEGSGMLYCTVASNADTYPTNMLSRWSTLDGATPVPVCRKLDENGNEIIPADYTVTGAGTEAVNGDYYATGNYISGTNGAIYKHKTNEVYLFGNGSNCFFAFEAVYSPAYYYTCETYSYDIQTGNWENAIYPSCGSGATPYPTVTKN